MDSDAHEELTQFLIAFRDRRKLSVSQTWELIVSVHSDAFLQVPGANTFEDGRAAYCERYSLDFMPTDVRLRVLSFLTIQNLALCAQVCKSWKIMVGAPLLWKEVDLSGFKVVDNSSIFGFCLRGRYLRSVNLSLDSRFRTDIDNARKNISWRGLHHLVDRCPNLRRLNVSMLHITDGFLRILATKEPYLEELDISFCPDVTNNGVALLQRCVNLRALYIRYCHLVSDYGVMEAIRGSPNLRILEVTGSTHITDATMRCIGDCCPSIEVLGVASTTITDLGVERIANYCPNLRSLDVAQCTNVTMGKIEYLIERDLNLRSLNIQGMYMAERPPVLHRLCPHLTSLSLAWCPNATDQTVRVLIKDMKEISELSLEMTQSITDVTLGQIAHHCPLLRSLDVFRCIRLSDLGMVTLLRACKHIVKLNIGACEGVGDATLKELAKGKPDLEWLCAFKTRISDRAIQALMEKCTKLTHFDIADSQCITDRALEVIARNANSLKCLDLTWCQGISAHSVAVFRERYPKIIVHRHTHEIIN